MVTERRAESSYKYKYSHPGKFIYILYKHLFCDFFLWDGQPGAGTREEGRFRKTKLYSMDRLYEQEAWHVQGAMGKTPGGQGAGDRGRGTLGLQPLLELLGKGKAGQDKHRTG